MSRRRLYLLLALIPTTLGAGSLAAVWWVNSNTDIAQSAPMPDAAPRGDEQPQLGSVELRAPMQEGETEASAAPSTVSKPQLQRSTPKKPAVKRSPVHVDSDEAANPVHYAATSTTHADDSASPLWTGSPLRLARLGGPIGGGGSNGSAQGTSPAPTENERPHDSHDAPQDGSVTPVTTVDDHSNDASDVPNGKEPGGDGPNANDPGSNEPGSNEPSDGKHDGDDSHTRWPPHTPGEPGAHEQPIQVPEPASLGLLALGLLGCAAARRKKA